MNAAPAILARNNVRVTGSGPRTLVFAHGFGCDQNMWRFVSPAFETRYRTVLFDYVGSGKSELAAFDAARYATLDGYAQDLLDVCEALDLNQVVLVGHSVSAMIGVLAANRAPHRFSDLIMLVPSPRFINDPPGYVGGFEQADIEGLLSLMDLNYIGWAGTLAPMVMGDPSRPELAAELEESFCSTDPAAAKIFARATFFADNRSDLDAFRHPALMIQVRDDALVPATVVRYLQDQLPGSVTVTLDGSGHCPHMSQPAATIDAIEKYLGRVDAAV